MSKRLTPTQWAELRTAYAGGAGLRELARNMGIPSGTILSRARREQWKGHIQAAKALTVLPPERTPDKTPMEAVVESMQQRGQRHAGRVASLAERMMSTFEQLPKDAWLEYIDQLEKLDKVARRTFGLDTDANPSQTINVLNMRFD